MSCKTLINKRRGAGRAIRRLAVVLALSVALSLAGTTIILAAAPAGSGAPVKAGPAEPSTQISRREAYEYHVLAGEMAIERGNNAVAAGEYAAAVRYSNDPALAERATRIALYADKPRLAYGPARLWAQARPQSLDAQRAVTRLAFVTGDSAHLADHAQALIAAAGSPATGYRLLASLLADRPGQAGLALATLKELAGGDPKSRAAEYARGMVALHYNQLDVAAKAGAAARKLDAQWPDGAMLQAAVWIRQGKIDKARQRIARLSGSADQRAQYHAQLAQLFIQAGANGTARDEFARAVQLNPDDGDARYGAGILSLGLGDAQRAQSQFQALYKADQHSDDAAFYLGEIAQSNGDYAQARHWYERVNDGSHVFTAKLRTADMLYRQDGLAAARAKMARLRQTFPDRDTQISVAEGELLVDAGHNKQALTLYNRALKNAPHNADLLYGRSLAYEKLGRVAPAEADLRAMLKHNHSDPRALNALGYMLTNHSGDYGRAAGYIRKALAAAPDNPAVLDSMGWVQYKLGKLDKARHNLEQAYKGSPDPEVAAHLGEVRWQQGDHEGARRIWQAAHARHPDNAVLNQTIKRFGS